MSTKEKRYTIDRKSASRLLKVSTRTVDRYIRQDKLSSLMENGRIWLSEAEIRTLKEVRRPKVEVVNVDMSKPRMSIDKSVHIGVDNVEGVSPSLSSQVYRQQGEEGVYKGLYEDIIEEYREYQEKLNRATYKMGQLEAQLKYSVPLLKHNKEKRMLTTSQRKLEGELDKALEGIKEFEQEYKIERFNKHVYLMILLGVLVLQPIFWLLMR
jgi:hypothetical protein